jgi:predicted RNA polymerase sigma factor
MNNAPMAIEAVWKIEFTRLIAAIARVTRDIGVADERAQDALMTALELGPDEGIPEHPGAWLMTAAKRRAIDSPKASSTRRRARRSGTPGVPGRLPRRGGAAPRALACERVFW